MGGGGGWEDLSSPDVDGRSEMASLMDFVRDGVDVSEG